MKKYWKIVYFSLLLFCNCKAYNEKAKGLTGEVPINKEPDSLFDKIRNLLPDTSFSSNNSKELSEYILGKQKIFNDYLEIKTNSNKFENEIFATNARRYFDDFQQYLWFKQIKKSPKNIKSVVLLSFASPYGKLVTIKERLVYFATFPKSIQQSNEGIRTKKKLEGYSFLNIGKPFFDKGILWGTDYKGKKINVGQVIKNSSRNTIIILGATYCGPCVYQERLLRKSYKYIDTAAFNIIGLSVDHNSAKWFAYVQKELLPWQSFVVDEGIRNPLIKRLNFEGIPRNFMLDKNGIIIDEHTDYRFFINKFGFRE